MLEIIAGHDQTKERKEELRTKRLNILKMIKEIAKVSIH